MYIRKSEVKESLAGGGFIETKAVPVYMDYGEVVLLNAVLGRLVDEGNGHLSELFDNLSAITGVLQEQIYGENK